MRQCIYSSFFLKVYKNTKIHKIPRNPNISRTHNNIYKSYVKYLKFINSKNITRMKILSQIIFVLVVSLSISKPIYDFKKSYVLNLTPINYADQVTKYRQNTNYVSVVQFYKSTDGKSKAFVPEMDKWANQYRGVFRIGAVDCEEYPQICEKQGVTQFPTFKIIPPVPIPVVTFKEQLTTENLQKTAAKYLHSNSIEITNANVNTFISENPSVPKVLLFTDKPKGTPMIYKGLSVAFEKKLNFGLVRSSDSVLVTKYNVKKFPTVIVIKTGEKKPIFYDGKQFNFENLFEFLNIYSEVFVPGGGSSLDSSATKQWMTQIFPEMHAKSAKDICTGVQSTLCVILITKQKPSKQLTTTFEALNAKFDRKIDRGAKIKFMWLNASIEKKWGELFKYDGKDKVVVLNPGKRKRYTEHQGDISKESVSQTLDSINGGDAKFNRVGDLPVFQIRTQ